MAGGSVSMIGMTLAAIVAGLCLVPLAAIWVHAGSWSGLGAAYGQAIVFTVTQAALSGVISCILAVPVARALARRQFIGRHALISVMGAPFILPVIVAVLALVAVFGRSGIVNDLLGLLGLPPFSIYGAHGVVLAHVFLNLPLAVRMLLLGWQSIPAERTRLATALGFGPSEIFRHLEIPMLRAVLPGAFVVIFVICLTSFAVALTLGGGPKATTVELAIYQAMKFDFDLGRAAFLAAIQFGLCATVALLAWRVARPAAFGPGMDRKMALPAPGGWRRWADGLAVTIAALFLLVPLLSMVFRGISGLLDLPSSVWWALTRSVGVALVSTVLCAAAALFLALGVARQGRAAKFMDAAAVLPLATSALVLGTGLFLIVHPLVSPTSVALGVTILVNALLSLPFVYRLLMPEAVALHADYGALMVSLRMQGLAALRLVVLPRLARPLGFGCGLAAAFAMGDLGVITLFAGTQEATLPLIIERLMGAYRIDQAMAAALVLVGASFGLFWSFDRWGRTYAAA